MKRGSSSSVVFTHRQADRGEFPGILIFALLVTGAGCHGMLPSSRLPVSTALVSEHLTVHADFPVPRRHRLIEELHQRRSDLRAATGLTLSDEPVHIHLFSDAAGFHDQIRATEPELAGRRAVFMQTDTELRVLALWGDRIAEDLRHEVIHGYLHGVIPDPPVWLDEGLAEYFELPRHAPPVHEAHVRLLAAAFRNRQWTPDLARLEAHDRPELLTQQDYAESWLWVHFLLHHSSASQAVLRDALEEMQRTGRGAAVRTRLAAAVPDPEFEVLAHLRNLAGQL